jgi:hypothetical protein
MEILSFINWHVFYDAPNMTDFSSFHLSKSLVLPHQCQYLDPVACIRVLARRLVEDYLPLHLHNWAVARHTLVAEVLFDQKS